MKVLSTEQNIQFGGYHGTDLSSADSIAAEGFRVDYGDVFFAPLDDLDFAQRHGAQRARFNGDRYYSVVQATFPAKRLEFGLGGDQIRVPVDEIGRIAVVSLRVYDLEQSKLILLKNREELHGQSI
jgi:hypothetical protein